MRRAGTLGGAVIAVAAMAAAVVFGAGLEWHQGTVEPPTTSGYPLSGDDQAELGAVTMRQLGKGIGDTITMGDGKLARRLTIVGTVTLTSIGVGLADHRSLGQGVMLTENTLLALTGAATEPAIDVSQPVFPSVAVIDLRPGTTPAQRKALVHRIVSANPDGTDGGTYELPPQLASSVLNAQQLPFTEIPLLTLVGGLAALIVAGNLLAAVPGVIAARTRAVRFLRAE